MCGDFNADNGVVASPIQEAEKFKIFFKAAVLLSNGDPIHFGSTSS